MREERCGPFAAVGLDRPVIPPSFAAKVRVERELWADQRLHDNSLLTCLEKAVCLHEGDGFKLHQVSVTPFL